MKMPNFAQTHSSRLFSSRSGALRLRSSVKLAKLSGYFTMASEFFKNPGEAESAY